MELTDFPYRKLFEALFKAGVNEENLDELAESYQSWLRFGRPKTLAPALNYVYYAEVDGQKKLYALPFWDKNLSALFVGIEISQTIYLPFMSACSARCNLKERIEALTKSISRKIPEVNNTPLYKVVLPTKAELTLLMERILILAAGEEYACLTGRYPDKLETVWITGNKKPAKVIVNNDGTTLELEQIQDQMAQITLVIRLNNDEHITYISLNETGNFSRKTDQQLYNKLRKAAEE